jgi:exodeoxyribonuclease V gamma subunit
VLHLHRAERADGLVQALAALLAQPLDDPIAPEIVSVPTRGMERWLTQRLSSSLGAAEGRRDGICANVCFPWPRRLVGDAVAAASGVQPDHDPWLPERATWPLLEVLETSLDEPRLRPVSEHLGSGSDPPDPVRRARRLSMVRHTAELFDRYALNRPEMISRWAAEDDTDGADGALPPTAMWQPELWRRLRGRIDIPGPAERLEPACARLRDDASVIDLPRRITLFGLTRLPAGHLRVLCALAALRDVHLFLLHPSPALWDQIARTTRGLPRPTGRRDDRTAELPSNRLLASWGRDAREMQLVLGAAEERVDHHHGLEFAADTVLARIQADIRADREPPGAPLPGRYDRRMPLAAEDRSIQVHACHGRARQVEVVRDAILHLLADDPTLEPRDLIVMCPDIETFAPLIQATFGAGEPGAELDDSDRLADGARPVDLRVRLADRSLRQTNPVLAFAAQLLDLADQRLTASQVLGLIDREPVRRRFALDDDDLARVQHWISQAAIRWGLDATHRAPYQLDALPTGTWRAGLDRILLGVAMSEEGQRLFESVLPVDDVDSGSIDLAGRFAELLSRLQEGIEALRAPQPIEDWAKGIGVATDALTATGPSNAWQRAALQRVLDELVGESAAQANGPSTALALQEVRGLLGDRLQGRPTRTNFRTGHLTVCTLHPMRSVPHRVVCLLGLDDGAFPRKSPSDGDDLMLDQPHIGERNPRTEDLQLLLDALLAATERLVITYTSNDERTNLPRPPAVVVGELLDAVDATAVDVTAGHKGGRARDQVVVHHPLQPFDLRNFVSGELVQDTIWSFDPVALEGAEALVAPRSRPGAFLERPLPALGDEVVELEDLARFVERPVRAFLRQRLRISLADFSEETEDGLRIELDGLQRWQVGERLLEARLAGVDGRTAALAEIARGTLPPGVLGQPVLRDVYKIVDAIVEEVGSLVPSDAPPSPVDVRVPLGDGRLLSGTVPGVRGDILLTTTFSRVSARNRLVSWVRLLALTAARPEREFSAVTVGRCQGGGTVTIAEIPTLGGDAGSRERTAHRQLAVLADLYARGMREPLPLYCKSSAAYAQAAVSGGDAIAAGREEWTSQWNFDKEDKEPDHQLVLGGVRTFDELLVQPPAPGEAGRGWEMSETTRFGRYARRLWNGLLASERVISK